MVNKSNAVSRNFIVFVAVAATVIAIAGYWAWQANQKPNETPNCQTIKSEQVCDSDYIGLSEAGANTKAKGKGLAYRVVERDGKSLPVTQDLNRDRLNFVIKDDKVTSVQFY